MLVESGDVTCHNDDPQVVPPSPGIKECALSLPPLTWDEDSCHWAGPVEVPWYRPMPSTAPAGVRWHSTTEPTELVVLPADPNTEGGEPLLTPAQKRFQKGPGS